MGAARILWHGVPPWAASAYGMQTGSVVRSLRDAGYEVMLTSDLGDGPLEWDGMQIFPAPSHAPDALHLWLEGSPRFDSVELVITFLDAFRLPSEPLPVPALAWIPVQNRPLDPATRHHFERSGARPVAVSRFGKASLEDAGFPDVPYVPHTIDAEVLRPLVPGDREASRAQAVARLGLDPDRRWIGVVAANLQPINNRKCWPELLAAVAELSRERSDLGLYLHTDYEGRWQGGGPLLPLLEATVGSRVEVTITDPVAFRAGLPLSEMAVIYNALDVLCAPSASEGFCVPMIEAQACGVPVVASDWSAQTENVGGGWLVSGQPRWFAPDRSFWFTPSIASITRRLDEALEAGADRFEECLAFAGQFEHGKVFRERWLPLVEGILD